MANPQFYDELKLLVHQLQDSLPCFTTAEQGEISGYLDANEYGIAVETAYHIILEEDKRISLEAHQLFRALTVKMNLDSVDLKSLEERVSSEKA